MSVVLCSLTLIDTIIGVIIAPRNGVEILTETLPGRKEVFRNVGLEYDRNDYISENMFGRMMLDLNAQAYKYVYERLFESKPKLEKSLVEWEKSANEYIYNSVKSRRGDLTERQFACKAYQQLRFWKAQACDSPNAENTAIWKALEEFEQRLSMQIIDSLPESKNIWG